MKIIFFGSDDFAAVHLQSLIKSRHHVVACVTQPDRPKGRGMPMVVSPVKEWAVTNKIPVLQPETLNDSGVIAWLRDFRGDIFVVIAYGRFLPRTLLDLPPLGAINVHGSLLPKYRGAAPINWVIINGERESGLTIIRINERMDAGDILAAKKVKIDAGETAVSLRAKMMDVGPAFLDKTLTAIASGKTKSVPQDETKATLAPKLIKTLGHVLWAKPAEEILNVMRGLIPWPGAFTEYSGKALKILDARVVAQDVSHNGPGEVVRVNKDGILVATGQNALLLLQVHLQDAKPMDAYSFVVGHELEVGYRFK